MTQDPIGEPTAPARNPRGRGIAVISITSRRCGAGTAQTPAEPLILLVATGSALIDKVTITSSGGFQDLRQTRISGVSTVPEPSSLLLLAVGCWDSCRCYVARSCPESGKLSIVARGASSSSGRKSGSGNCCLYLANKVPCRKRRGFPLCWFLKPI